MWATWALKDPFRPWSSWALGGILSHIYSSRSQLAAMGIQWEDIQEELVVRHPRSSQDALSRKSLASPYRFWNVAAGETLSAESD